MTESSESESNGFIKVKHPPDISVVPPPTLPRDPRSSDDDDVLLLTPYKTNLPLFEDTFSEPSCSPERHPIRTPGRRRKRLELLQDEADRFIDKPFVRGRLPPRKSLYPLTDPMQNPLPSEFAIDDTEINLRVPLPGQSADQANPPPIREHFVYAYHHIEEPACQKYLTAIVPWIQHNNALKKPDPSHPVLDRENNAHNIPLSLPDILNLPANRTFLDSRPKTTPLGDKQSVSQTPPPLDQQLPATGHPSTPTHGNIIPQTGSPAGHHTSTPSPTPPSSPHTTPQPTPPDSPNMALREKSVFFPTTTFDGKDKSLTRAHWQSFRDFVDRQTWDGANGFRDQCHYFKMTLRDLARQWFETTPFDDLNDLATKFLTEFSPYGKRQRQWLHHWINLKYNPDTDNIDEYIQKFQDLARLLNYPNAHQLQVFKMAMPPNVELQIRGIDDLNRCFQEAKECLSICQVTDTSTKLSTLAIARSPSPRPNRSRSPSPIPKPGPRQSRPRQPVANKKPQFSGFRQYPGRPQVRPRSLSRPRSGPPFRQNQGPPPNPRYRPRSISRPRNIPQRNIPTCFYCGIRGHTIAVCRKRIRNRNLPFRLRQDQFDRRYSRPSFPRNTNPPRYYNPQYSEERYQNPPYQNPPYQNPPYQPRYQETQYLEDDPNLLDDDDRHVTWRDPVADNTPSPDPDLNP